MSDCPRIVRWYTTFSLSLIVMCCCAQGSESDIRAKFYSMAFRQEYEEDSGVVGWKIVDYEFAGDVPYL